MIFKIEKIILFYQEAHKMVQDANMKRAQAEKALAESEMKVNPSTC